MQDINSLPTRSLKDLLERAVSDRLDGRDRRVFELRFELLDGHAQALETIGVEFDVSKERVRQLLERCLSKIKSTGSRQLRKNDSHLPCAALLNYLNSEVEPDNDSFIERLIGFSKTESGNWLAPERVIWLTTKLLFDI